MPGTNPKPLLATVLLAVVVAGCNDSTTAPAEPLNQEEAEALFDGVLELASDTMPDIISMTADGGVLACPLGGQATVVFDIQEGMSGDTASLSTNIMLDPQGCVLSSDGYEFTVDGNPNIQLAVEIAIVTSTFEFLVDGSLTGGLDWRLDDRSGTCMFDLVFDADIDPSQVEPTPTGGTYSGTLCGMEVELEAG